MIDDHLHQIIYSIPQNQEINFPDDLKKDRNFTVFKGLPNFEDFTDGKHRLIVIDDQVEECTKEIVALFTRGSHHFNLSVVVLTQNIFVSTPGFRTMSLNSHYLILFKNPRGKDQTTALGRQISTDNVKFFQDAYNDATRKPHSYLLLDMTQATDEQLRYRANIFPDDDDCTTIYIPIEHKGNKN